MLEGHEDLQNFMHKGLLDRDFDMAFSNELKIDHSTICPIITVCPDNDLPVVPIYANIFAPPLPSPKRFYQLGRAIREIIDEYPSDKRIAAIGSGHLSRELGGPRMFKETGPDPKFDNNAIEWLRNGDIEAILENVTHERLAASGNATGGFMEFILMLGIAGPKKADYVDNLDLFHLVSKRSCVMSEYYVNKFLFQIDRDPELLRRYKEDPATMVAVWEQSIGPRLNDAEMSTVHSLTDHEREVLINHDYVALFEMGAHFFLCLTIYIAIYDEDYMAEKGPLAFQYEYAKNLKHWLGKDYPSVQT